MLGGALLAAAAGTLLVLVAHTQEDFLDGVATSTAYTQGLHTFLVTFVCVLAVGLARYRLDNRLARLRLPSVRWRVVVPALVVAGALVLVATDLPARVHEFASAYGQGGAGVRQGHLISASGSGRYQFWQAALDAFTASPVKGVGAGNFELYWNAHPEAPLWIMNAHSLYLETLAELGIAGLALVVGFLGAAAVSGVRRAKGSLRPEVAAALAVLATGILSAALEWTWQLPAAFAPVVIAVALLTGPATAKSAATGESTASMTRGRFAVGAGAVAIGCACAWAAGIALVTDVKLDASRSAATRGDLASAADDAREAAGIQPWSPEPRLQLALVEELAGNLRSARNAADEAIQRAPHDWRTWAVAARIEAGLHEKGASKESAAFASALSLTRLPAALLRPLGR